MRHSALVLPAVVFFASGCGSELSGAEIAAIEDAESGLGSPVRIRIMAGNLTSGTLQSYTPGEGTRIFQGLEPDIALVQEMNYRTNSQADISAWVSAAFGPSFSYFREAGAQIPNGVVSRWPILQAGEWDDPYVANRDFSWARIDIPGPVDLWAVSLHFLTTSTSARANEAAALVGYLKSQVPTGDYLVVGGDLNTSSRSEACLTTLRQLVVASGTYPADQNGNTFTNGPRSRPYDWVLVDPDLEFRQAPVVVGQNTFANGLVADTRVYSPIAELAPALATDSGAVNMQHMGVVRDFSVPGDAVASVIVNSPNGGETWQAGTVHAVTWTASNADAVDLEYTIDGASFSPIASGLGAALGTFDWAPPATASAMALVRVRTTDGVASDLSDGVFEITVPSTPARVFINEILANEPGSSTAGEFVEIVNGGDSAADLSGWTVADGASVRHVFASGTRLAPRGAIVVFGGAAAIPPGLISAVAASGGTLSLANAGDSVKLSDAGAVLVDAHTYALASNDGVSLNRNPDAQAGASFAAHTHGSALPNSPGTRVDGSAF